MNNREYLNTLSDEEFANEWLKIEKMLHGDCGFHIEVITQYLQAKHLTTADEDFEEINFFLNNFKEFGKPSEVVSYGCGHDSYMVAIFKDGRNVYTADTGLRWTDEMIDQIRTIADKKRKEMWG